ncbi:MAG: hypothetical protein DRJ63_10065 [Thermoprotei archaeon]|nr:MAG: hypothetical protein DRJ63_10065 [Thermoprotei archaeon]
MFFLKINIFLNTLALSYIVDHFSSHSYFKLHDLPPLVASDIYTVLHPRKNRQRQKQHKCKSYLPKRYTTLKKRKALRCWLLLLALFIYTNLVA